jgi:uncharacterized protein YkuJ
VKDVGDAEITSQFMQDRAFEVLGKKIQPDTARKYLRSLEKEGLLVLTQSKAPKKYKLSGKKTAEKGTARFDKIEAISIEECEKATQIFLEQHHTIHDGEKELYDPLTGEAASICRVSHPLLQAEYETETQKGAQNDTTSNTTEIKTNSNLDLFHETQEKKEETD